MNTVSTGNSNINMNFDNAPPMQLGGNSNGIENGNGNGNSGGKGNNSNEQVDFTNFLKHASNPCVVLFTILFKAASIICFLMLNLFLNNEALVFILVVIFSAFDFWFVKNVSGR